MATQAFIMPFGAYPTPSASGLLHADVGMNGVVSVSRFVNQIGGRQRERSRQKPSMRQMTRPYLRIEIVWPDKDKHGPRGITSPARPETALQRSWRSRIAPMDRI
jgi:hypothetical protein